MRDIFRSAILLLIPRATAQLVLQEQQPIQSPTACHLLAATFPGLVAAISDKRYTTSQSSYWSARQADLKRDCRFYPKGAREIQEALADILIPYNVSIAVTSGGHSSTVDASNVDQGVTIDLSNFNSALLVDDDEAVILGVACSMG
ncbi:putative FAD-binding, type PCMH, subdomain 2, FAD-binding, type PCMH-like superfamily [Septoria linicola]|nr:putative FAD-binding, type PCMH, subdomain 2, FAD-binding, type PCMH-like superfamily [Septoria linicola]